jgi:hypothetical protein
VSSDVRARVFELVIGGSTQPWVNVGIHFDLGGRFMAGAVSLLIDSQLAPGIHGWSLLDSATQSTSIDGIPTTHAVGRGSTVAPMQTPEDVFALQISRIDHLVVSTDDLMRTSDALSEATGAPRLRVRDGENGVQQAFHRMGEVIIEIVTMPQNENTQASIWGIAFLATDLDNATAFLGPDVLGQPKPATQKGQVVASFRSAAGLGVPCVLMADAPQSMSE